MKFPMKRLLIEDAEDQQIADWTEACGVDIEGATSRAALLALLETVHNQPWILVPDVPENVNDLMLEQIEAINAPAQQRLEGGIGDNDPKVRLIVNKTGYPGGDKPVAVSVNGRTVVIQRGMTVDVPYRYYHALENAVYTEVTQPDITKERVENDVTNYPMSVKSFPDRAELRAWRERVDNEVMPA